MSIAARVPAPTGSGTAPCVTHAPPTDIPQASFLPDGSSPNITLFNASKTGITLQYFGIISYSFL